MATKDNCHWYYFTGTNGLSGVDGFTVETPGLLWCTFSTMSCTFIL